MTSSEQASGERRPYEVPTVVDLGTVAAVTEARSKSGVAKDGGPNNIKS